MEYKFPLPQTPFKNTEDEISHLRKLIAEKEKALEDIGLKKELRRIACAIPMQPI